ncbi:MAG: hypothetical protein H0W72_03465 [Planctomycetes bacterium]|nr:hypothetical protein [Planctomycetota bacterium]
MRISVHLLALLALATGPAQGAEVEPSDTAKRAIASAEQAVLDQYEQFRAAALKEQQRLVAALDKEMVRETKAGRLEGAQAVRQALETVKDPQWVDAVVDAADVDLLGNPRKPNQVVLWNQHNGIHGDRGTATARVVLLLADRVVARGDPVEVPWKADADTSVTVPLPKVRWDGVRIEVETVHGIGGGLAEVQVLVAGRNIAPQLRARASACFPNPAFTADRINDGVTSSAQFGVGYWLLPTVHPGWIELVPSGGMSVPTK